MSARSLTVRHMAEAVRFTREGEVTDPKKLDANQMRLYSFYKPSLLATDYVVDVKQRVSIDTQSLDILNTNATDNSGAPALQEFEVVVPRFSLDADLINSYYPPDGHQDEGRILPHIVLNDPHYPWEIPAGTTTNMDGKIDPQTITDSTGKGTKIFRGMVPWVALLVFDPDELHLPTLKDITDLGIPGYATELDVPKQNPQGLFSMTVSDYFSKVPASSRINFQAGTEITGMTSAVNVIFPPKTLFREIFASDQDTDSHKVGVEALKYMAHVRHINTTGFPDAGVVQEGLYSIVISSRTGAYAISQPQAQVCHLVSIEHVDSTLGTWLDGGSDRIGMVSLFSWIYTALPPDPINFVDTIRNLTENQQMLRTNDVMLKELKNSISNDGSVKSQAAAIMEARLSNGYTVARWRTQTGEETASFSRGPLVPQPVTWPPTSGLPDCSLTSQEYQILDPQTGLVDLSYSSAWQAGKLLAISDTVFSAALMRFRSAVHNSSANTTRMMTNNMKTKSTLLPSVKDVVVSIRAKSSGETGDPQRFRSTTGRSVAPTLRHPDVRLIMRQNVKETVSTNTNAGQDIYTEFNLDGPNNNDWAIIHSWLCEKLSLGGIPPQYLIPEPAFVPPESLRFFYIDDFWLDCLLDGALSVANHLDKDDDVVRREIKETFNVYLHQVVPDAGYKPQIPSYGFLIRSKIIKAMPDLRITVAWQTPDNRAPVCRWTKWDDETLMCLLDRQPQELASITLAQPLHQQRYSLGSHLDSTQLTFTLRRLFTQGAPAPPQTDLSWPEKPIIDPVTGKVDRTLPNTWFDFATRCLKINKMATDINSQLQFGKSTDVQAYIDPTPNSCEFGLELNDPSYFFRIVPPVQASAPPRDRQLYIRGAESADAPGTPTEPQPSARVAARAPPPTSSKPKDSVPPSETVRRQPTRISLPRPPHQQLRMQPQPQPSGAAAVARLITATATATSKFDLTVFADYKGVPTRYTQDKYDPNDYVPTNNVYFFDLIFSIRKKPMFSTSNFKLLKIAVDIPTTTIPPPANPKFEALLTANYDGPGLRMLSNQRFIPFLFYNDESGGDGNANMHIELIPRSANDNYALTISDRKTQETGFRLGEANISTVVVSTPVEIVGEPKRQPRGKVKIIMTEWYSTAAFPKGEPVASSYTLIKWAKQDDSV